MYTLAYTCSSLDCDDRYFFLTTEIRVSDEVLVGAGPSLRECAEGGGYGVERGASGAPQVSLGADAQTPRIFHIPQLFHVPVLFCILATILAFEIEPTLFTLL